jgi:hypothetical protein
MIYRTWNITTFSTYLGYLAQYTSPTGQAHHTSACFPSNEQAVSYAQTQIDYLMRCERSRTRQEAAPRARCA